MPVNGFATKSCHWRCSFEGGGNCSTLLGQHNERVQTDATQDATRPDARYAHAHMHTQYMVEDRPCIHLDKTAHYLVGLTTETNWFVIAQTEGRQAGRQASKHKRTCTTVLSSVASCLRLATSSRRARSARFLSIRWLVSLCTQPPARSQSLATDNQTTKRKNRTPRGHILGCEIFHPSNAPIPMLSSS